MKDIAFNSPEQGNPAKKMPGGNCCGGGGKVQILSIFTSVHAVKRKIKMHTIKINPKQAKWEQIYPDK